MTVEDRISPADEVIFVEGAFSGMRAFVLRIMPAKKRVQLLMEVLGGPTPVEVERSAVMLNIGGFCAGSGSPKSKAGTGLREGAA